MLRHVRWLSRASPGQPQSCLRGLVDYEHLTVVRERFCSIAQAKRLKELERENERLKKAVSELTLDKLILKEALTGKY